MYEYRARVSRVVDGDTIDLAIDVGFYITMTTRVRLRGVNTPEVRGAERAQGLVSSAYVKERLPAGMGVLVRTYKVGKYGRYIADVCYLPGEMNPTVEALRDKGVDIGAELLEKGLAEPIDAEHG